MVSNNKEIGRRERKKREVRARIYAAAQTRFSAQGFDATTVDQICEDVDISQATFFNYFASKRAVLTQMAAEAMDLLYVVLDEELARDASTQDKLEHYFVLSASGVSKRVLFSRDVLLEVMRTATPPGGGRGEMGRIHLAYQAIVRDGQLRGDVRTDLDVAVLAEMVFGAFAAIFTNWLNDPSYPIEQRAKDTARFVGEAISPREG
jgi:AcrR family transcriptional regulator